MGGGHLHRDGSALGTLWYMYMCVYTRVASFPGFIAFRPGNKANARVRNVYMAAQYTLIPRN